MQFVPRRKVVEGRQLTYNVTLGAYLQPLFQWKNNKYYMLWVCVCSLRYPACNAHSPYCHLWPAPLYRIFPHYPLKGTIFEGRVLNTKCVFWFSVQLLYETFLVLRRTERDMIKTVRRYSCEVPLCLSDFNGTWILATDFRKILKYWIS